MNGNSFEQFKELKENMKFYFLGIKLVSPGRNDEQKIYEITMLAEYKSKGKKFSLYTNFRH